MARPSIYLILVSFFVATTVITISAIDQQETLAQCAEHIGPNCGKKVLDNVLKGNENSTISTNCCYKLVQTGYQCHTKLTLYILKNSPELKNANWTGIMARNDEVYDKCDVLTNPGTPENLARCAENIGSECGEQVYKKVVQDNKNKKITKHCCEKLVRMGEACHDDMGKALIRTPELRNVDAVHLLKKNKEVFDNCLHAKQSCTRILI